VEGAGRVHFQSYVSNLSMTLCTLLRDLQDPGQVAAARFNVYATPILREAVVRLLAAAGQRLNGCDEEHSWKSAVDYARQDALFNVRKHVL